MSEPLKSYHDFWPYYLGEHSRPGTRALHIVGTTMAVALVLLGLLTSDWHYLPAAFVGGYAFAWAGHFFIERNRPATFKYPIWSLISDFRMLGIWLTGSLDANLKRHAGRTPL